MAKNRLVASSLWTDGAHAAMRFRDLNDDIDADLGGREPPLKTGQLQLVAQDVLPPLDHGGSHGG